MPHTYPMPRQPALSMKHESNQIDRYRRRMLLGALAYAAQPVLAQGPYITAAANRKAALP